MAQAESRPTSSPDPRMMLVPYRAGQTWKRVVMWVLCISLVAAGFFAVGYWKGMREDMHLFEQRTTLRDQVEDLQRSVQTLQEAAAIHRHGNELERQASERVRQENIALQNRVSELEEAVTFYKGIMAPENNEKGLRIERFELSQTRNKKRFKYKVVMTQVADNGSFINGNVTLNLLGVRQGSRESIPFDKLSRDLAGGDGAAFNFRFFQDIGGELVVPEDFMPEQVEVIAQSKGRKVVRLEKRFDWKIQEVTSNVGKG